MDRNCATCKHADKLCYEHPCSGCINKDDFPGWQPKDTPAPVYTTYAGVVPGVPGFVGFVKQSVYNRLKAENSELDKALKDLQAENERLMDYAADLGIAMRKARKVLKPPPGFYGGDAWDKIDEARQILKEGLKTE